MASLQLVRSVKQATSQNTSNELLRLVDPGRTSTMGTNTSSPAAYVDTSAGVSGMARMGGAQPRNKPPSKPSQDTALTGDGPTVSTTPRHDASIRPSVDTLPPYQPAENRSTSHG